MAVSISSKDEVVLEFVRDRRVLDVGCGLGKCGNLIKIHLVALRREEPEVIVIIISRWQICVGANIFMMRSFDAQVPIFHSRRLVRNITRI